MAAKKKRSRGLSGSPEHHAVQSGLGFEAALSEYKKADALAKSGMCKMAFRSILSARGSEGEAKAHMREAGSLESFSDSCHGSAVEPEAKARTAAWKAFESKCIGASLSGMKRRSRR